MTHGRLVLTLGLAFITFTLGCRRGPAEAPPEPRARVEVDAPEPAGPPLAPPEVEAFVRLPSGTRLYQAPREDAPSVLLRLAEGESRAAEVVAITGEWVALLLGSTEEIPFRCHPLLSAAPLEVRIWARIDALAEVTSELIEVNFDDLTFVILMRGVPVRRTGERDPKGRLYEVVVDGLRLTLPLPEARLGRSYDPSPPVLADEEAAPAGGLQPQLRVGGQTILGDLHVERLPPTGMGQFAEARGECVDLLAWLTGEEGRPPPGPRRPVNPAFDRGDRPEDARLGEGVALRWLDDSPAGVTVGEVQAAAGRFGERLCFDALDGATDPPLVLCAAARE